METSENMIKVGNQQKRAKICKVCGKEGYLKDIKQHIEAKHLEGVSIPCNLCGKILRWRHALSYHISRNRKDHWSFFCRTRDALRTHRKSHHWLEMVKKYSSWFMPRSICQSIVKKFKNDNDNLARIYFPASSKLTVQHRKSKCKLGLTKILPSEGKGKFRL